jgi:hypothetical protein
MQAPYNEIVTELSITGLAVAEMPYPTLLTSAPSVEKSFTARTKRQAAMRGINTLHAKLKCESRFPGNRARHERAPVATTTPAISIKQLRFAWGG